MKLLKSLALVVSAALMITACGGGSGSTPSEVAKKFIEATSSFDFAKAKQYVTKEHQAAYDELNAKMDSPEVKATMEMMKSFAANVKIDVVNEKIEGDNAEVTIKLGGMEAMGVPAQEQTIHLVKEDGAWKINENPGM
jgi:ABC-type glycerol-3-phosphate transport system substrate-binding protein